MQEEYSDFRISELMATLKAGHNNATKREDLALKLDLSDRKVRSLIEKARQEGCLIMNNQDGRGYYLPASIEDIERQYWQDTNRALAIFKRRKHMRRLLKEAGLKV